MNMENSRANLGANKIVTINMTEAAKGIMWKFIKFHVFQPFNSIIRFGLSSIVVWPEPKASTSRKRSRIEEFIDENEKLRKIEEGEQNPGKKPKKNKRKNILKGVVLTTSGVNIWILVYSLK